MEQRQYLQQMVLEHDIHKQKKKKLNMLHRNKLKIYHRTKCKCKTINMEKNIGKNLGELVYVMTS